MRAGRVVWILASAVPAPGCFLLTRGEVAEHDLAIAGSNADTDAVGDTGTVVPLVETGTVTETDLPVGCAAEPLPAWGPTVFGFGLEGGYRVVTGNFTGAATAGVAVVAPTETWIGQSEVVRDQVQLDGALVPRPGPATDVAVTAAIQLAGGVDYVTTAEPEAARITVIQAGSPLPVADLHFYAHAPSSVAAGDVNTDGITDLVYLADDLDELAVMAGNPDGLDNPIVVATGVPGGLVRVADVDGDGGDDIVVVDALGVVRMWTWRAAYAGDLAFTAGATVPIPDGTAPAAVVIGDFDADGRADIAVAMPASHVIHVLLSDPAGGLRLHASIGDIADPRDLVAVDLGAAGCTSLVVADGAGGRIVALAGRGDGTFAPASEVMSVSRVLDGEPVSVAVADLDGRGAPDVVAVTGLGNVFLSTGAP